MGSGTVLNAEQRNAILRFALAGLKPRQVAQRLGLNLTTIYKHWPTEKKNAPKRNTPA